MIETICNIGKIVQDIEGEKDLVDLWQKEENGDYELIIDVNICDDSVFIDTRDFEKQVFRDGLLYTQGNWFVGALIKKDSLKDSRIKDSLKFIDIPLERLNEVKQLLDSRLKDYEGINYVVLFKKNGQKPIDISKQKFLDEIEKKGLRKGSSPGFCQICGQHTDALCDSIIYKCYTNDKEIFSNTEGLSYGICKSCIQHILFGKKHVDTFLKTWWGGSEILFLPHDYNEEIKEIFEFSNIGDVKEGRNLLKNLRENEADVMEAVGKCDTEVDILFISAPAGKSEWKITYKISDVMPSKFTKIAEFERKYKTKSGNHLALWQILSNLLGNSSKPGEIFNTNEAKNFLKNIFHGNKINRNLFFSRAMGKYKHDYFAGYKSSIFTIHRVYNFLVDCGCLDKGWNFVEQNDRGYDMAKYENVEEFFEINKEFFDSDVKKAWFLLGRLYGKMIYESKKYKGGDDKQNTESYLEKNFFFGRKYDFKTFVYFTNQCSELMYKYGAQNKGYLKDLISSSKELMGIGDEKLSSDEAKYIFFWGMQQWIGKSKDDITDDKGAEE
ncbi:CRISPR-associated protein, Csh1 family [Methanosarcina sp. MTP4]|uniref:TIGR02556 family CRISPR-associated protein n=1 Tax=Methanosarcina sp. MTP4 TaxID=1434100 RepID=UPI0006158949|nr:TIGR02556 family CRISPR-associated protein [Methanosarcina sp. MTP4]AKB26303.1 CRISPR-associated protein, Csh1 family [Methanosarcina sp. MTP4]